MKHARYCLLFHLAVSALTDTAKPSSGLTTPSSFCWFLFLHSTSMSGGQLFPQVLSCESTRTEGYHPSPDAYITGSIRRAAVELVEDSKSREISLKFQGGFSIFETYIHTHAEMYPIHFGLAHIADLIRIISYVEVWEYLTETPGTGGEDSTIPLQGTKVQSLARKLRDPAYYMAWPKKIFNKKLKKQNQSHHCKNT